MCIKSFSWIIKLRCLNFLVRVLVGVRGVCYDSVPRVCFSDFFSFFHDYHEWVRFVSYKVWDLLLNLDIPEVMVIWGREQVRWRTVKKCVFNSYKRVRLTGTIDKNIRYFIRISLFAYGNWIEIEYGLQSAELLHYFMWSCRRQHTNFVIFLLNLICFPE